MNSRGQPKIKHLESGQAGLSTTFVLVLVDYKVLILAGSESFSLKN